MKEPRYYHLILGILEGNLIIFDLLDIPHKYVLKIIDLMMENNCKLVKENMISGTPTDILKLLEELSEAFDLELV